MKEIEVFGLLPGQWNCESPLATVVRYVYRRILALEVTEANVSPS